MKTRLKSFKIIESQYVNPLDKLKQLSLHKQHTGQFTAGLNPNISCFCRDRWGCAAQFGANATRLKDERINKM